MDALLQDCRYAVRHLLGDRLFAALTILCLGLGVNSTIFSCVDTVAIRPLPFRDPEALVSLHGTQAANGIDRGGASYLDFRDWQEQTHSFSALASAPLGIALEYGGLQWLTASIPPEGQVPYYVNWDMNWRVVIYTGVIAVLTGLVFGLAPALHAADADLYRSLKMAGAEPAEA